ncbi:MAG: guanylate kinase [Lachnospiraceae bacterium]|nr:guanylate kinase [Lachnospiraceae bacterium]
MGKIYCICGKSSTGKDTVYKRLLSDKDLNLHQLVTYTTRPIREGEENGREYYFIDEVEAGRLYEEGKIVESRAYNTVYGIWKYMTVDNGDIELDKKSYVVIGTLESYIQIRNYFGRDKIIPIMIDVDDGERLDRALRRERSQSEPKYEEMCRRFLADSSDFSKEKVKNAGIEKVFVNDVLEDCINEVRSYIVESEKEV